MHVVTSAISSKFVHVASVQLGDGGKTVVRLRFVVDIEGRSSKGGFCCKIRGVVVTIVAEVGGGSTVASRWSLEALLESCSKG